MTNKLTIPHSIIQQAVKIALYEDLAGHHDLTSSLIPESKPANAYIITRKNMVLCGQAWVNEVLRQIDETIIIDWRSLLTAERTILNFLQLLSATATITHQYAQQLAASNTRLLDTRKTIPGLRLAQKYAIRCGGGCNHRIGLYDAFLIKENHIHACGSITKAISTAKKTAPNKKITVEVENLSQLKEAIHAKADQIMLDNFTLEAMQQAVAINKGQVKLEVSGNINLTNIRQVAETGVDYISVGALTKNIEAIDLSMQFE